MPEFKVGDIVRRLHNDNCDITVGSVYKVTSVNGKWITVSGSRCSHDSENFVLENTISKSHPHAELMAQYAVDAKETDKPWERWEVKHREDSKWKPSVTHPSWYSSSQYRRKPKTININGFEVPEPVRTAPDRHTRYWIAQPCYFKRYTQRNWFGSCEDERYLNRGLIHTTREAAELHAKALLSFTTKD